MPSIAIIIPSSGRWSLRDTVGSAAYQLRPSDQLLVDVNDDGDYGNAARRRMMQQAHTDLLMFQDDDDVYLDNALDVVRAAAIENPYRVLIFRMLYRQNRHALWTDPVLRQGNVASQMICVPNIPPLLGEWTDRYESDFDFVSSTCERIPPVWFEDIISLVNHPQIERGDYRGP